MIHYLYQTNFLYKSFERLSVAPTIFQKQNFFSTCGSFRTQKALPIMGVYSNKYIRLARGAKIANNTSFLKMFTPFVKNKHNQSFSGEANRSSDPKTQFSLLFLNQGLSSKDLFRLRSNLKPLGISFSHLPTRFWSNSFLSASNNEKIHERYKDKNLNFKKAIHGNILSFFKILPTEDIHTNLSFYNPLSTRFLTSLTENDPIYFVFETIQKNLIKQDISNLTRAANKDIASLYFNPLYKDNHLIFSRLTLPWDLLASQPVENVFGHENVNSLSYQGPVTRLVDVSNQLSLGAWFKDSNVSTHGQDFVWTHINLLLDYWRSNRLTYVGLLNSSDQPNARTSYLLYDNIKATQDKSFVDNLFVSTKQSTTKLYQYKPKYNRISSVDFRNNAFFCFEPFFFSCFNRKYLFFI